MRAESDQHMFSRNIVLVVFLLALTILPMYLPLAFSSSYTYTGALYYIVQISIRSSNGLSVPIECVVKVNVVNNEIRSAEIISVNYLSSFNLPPDIVKIIEYSLKYWLNNIVLFSNQRSGTETYVSIEGKIVKSYVVNHEGFTEYREANTGFYIGGVINNIVYKSSTGSYSIDLMAYLYKLSPDTLLKHFAIIEPPREKVILFGTILLLIILGGVIHTFYKWRDYRLT